MIIIVEGPDGAGKSTLIEKLLRAHPDSKAVHFSNPKTDEEAFGYWKVYAEAILATDPNKVTIFDRSWYSDRVYAPIFRNRIEMDITHLTMLEALVIWHGGGHVIYCHAPYATLWTRCQKRGETYVTSKDKLIAVANAYHEVMTNECGLPVISYDTKN